jgi:hypothetical protein
MASKLSNLKPAKLKPLWSCPKCGEQFVTKNLWHSCGKFTIKELFAKSEPHVLELFRKFEKMVRACGPAKMIPQKTRAVFQVRMRFAGCYPRKKHLLCTVVLRRNLNAPRISKTDEYAPHCFVHQFRIYSDNELDEEVQRWLCESYDVGLQKHLIE